MMIRMWIYTTFPILLQVLRSQKVRFYLPSGSAHVKRAFFGPAMEGVAVWRRIMKAIEELLSEERPDDAEVH